jgi:hypothetical protein
MRKQLLHKSPKLFKSWQKKWAESDANSTEPTKSCGLREVGHILAALMLKVNARALPVLDQQPRNVQSGKSSVGIGQIDHFGEFFRKLGASHSHGLPLEHLPCQRLICHRFLGREFGQERVEHERLHTAAIKAPAELLQIAVEVIFTEFVVAAHHAALEQ